MKKTLLISIIGIFLVIVDVYLLWPDEEKILQSAPMILLVFITLYYAIETQILVKESEKKREADFYERRIDGFYSPCLSEFHDLLNISEIFALDTSNIQIQIDIEKTFFVLTELHNKKAYMIPKATSHKFKKWLFKYNDKKYSELFKNADERKIYMSDLVDAYKLIRDEKIDVDENIRNIFGSYIAKKSNTLKRVKHENR